MRLQSQGRAHDAVVEDGRAGIDEQLTPLGGRDDTVEISCIGLLNLNLGLRTEKVTRADWITVATRDVMALTSE